MFRALLLAITLLISGNVPTPPPITPQEPIFSDYELIIATSSPVDEIPTPIAESEPVVELGGASEELDYKSQCVYYARQNSQFQPPKVRYAKEVPPIRFEPGLGYWSIYDAGGQYGLIAGHVGVVIEVGDNWFQECGRNLDGKGSDYCRKVYYKGEKRDKYLKGFFGYEI